MSVIVSLLLQLPEGRPAQSVQLDHKLFTFFISHQINIYRKRGRGSIII